MVLSCVAITSLPIIKMTKSLFKLSPNMGKTSRGCLGSGSPHKAHSASVYALSGGMSQMCDYFVIICLYFQIIIRGYVILLALSL